MFDLTLTFDNGPAPEVTPAVLSILKQHEIFATFFVIGQKLQDPKLRALAVRGHDEGHWIGNHTFSHSAPLGTQDETAPDREIAPTQKLMGSLAHPEKLFRPNGDGGHLDHRLLSASALQHLVQHRYTCVLWNSVPEDWKRPDDWMEVAISDCRRKAWTVMVLHDLPTGAMTHLSRFIGQARDVGARFRQEFAPDCVPMRRGEMVGPIESYVSVQMGQRMGQS